MAITRSQMKRQLYSIGGGAIKGTDAGNGREGFFKPVPGSPMANLLNTLPPGDLRHYGIGFGRGPGRKNLGSTGGGFGPQTGNEAIYPRIGGLRSGISSAEQELQDILQSIDQVQSTLGAPSEGDGYPKIPAGGLSQTLDGSSMSSIYSTNYIGAVGDPRLGAPDVPNSLQQVMRGARADGGMMGRQMYGLGSLVKKAVKGVKSFVKSDLGKAALLTAGGFGLVGMGPLKGLASFGGLGGLKTGVGEFIGGLSGGKLNPFGAVAGDMGPTSFLYKAGKFLGSPKGITAISGLSALAAAGLDPNNPNEMPRDIESLKAYLRSGYMKLNPGAEPEDVDTFVEANTVEYKANGGRIGFAEGMLSFEEAKAMNPGMFSAEVETNVVRPNTELLNYIKRIRDAAKKGIIPMDFAMDLIKQKTMEQGVDLQDLRDDIMETQRVEQAYGGRLGFAFGNKPEQNAIQAAGIMNLPLHQNPAGVTELDLRETGGFIPPVGVKEKADDIPAMLSNNEFVFTAKSVKEMGDGDVNKGAQRMYDMMKKLENGGRV